MEKLDTLVSSRQLTVFFLLVAPLTKFLVLPSLLFFTASRDAYIVVLCYLAIDIIFLALMLDLVKNDKRTLSEILTDAIGTVGKNIVFVILGLYFLLKTLMPVLEQALLSHNILYESSPSLALVIPIFAVLCYGGIVGFKSSFRTIELLTMLFAFGIVTMILSAMFASDVQGIFPVLEYGVSPIIKSLFSFSLWFGDFVILLPLLGNIKKVKHTTRNILIAFTIGMATVTVMYIIILGIFGVLAPRQLYIITKVSKYSVALSNLGRVDFLFIAINLVGMILHTTILFTSMVYFFHEALKINKTIISWVISILLLVFTMMYLLRFKAITNIVISAFSYFVLAVQYIFPLIIYALAKWKKALGAIPEKSDEQTLKTKSTGKQQPINDKQSPVATAISAEGGAE